MNPLSWISGRKNPLKINFWHWKQYVRVDKNYLPRNPTNHLMQVNQDFEEFFESLNNNGVQYLVVGGYAYAIYAEPRYTKDLDIWVLPETQNGSLIIAALHDFGFSELELTAEDFHEPDRMIQIGHPPLRIDILTSIDALIFESAWENKSTAFYGEQEINIIGKRDLITNKEATGREQDKLDAKRLRQI